MGKEPPCLSDGSSYKQWKRDITLWEAATDIDVKKRAPRCVLMMQGKVREHASRMDITELVNDGSMKYLLDALDNFFKEDETQ